MSLDKRTVEEVLGQWEKDPRSMLDWRAKTFRRNLLLLEALIYEAPPHGARNWGNIQLRAMEILNKMMALLEQVRDEMPTVCPKCEMVFVPGQEAK